MARKKGIPNRKLSRDRFKPYTKEVILKTLAFISNQIHENKVSSEQKEELLEIWQQMKRILES